MARPDVPEASLESSAPEAGRGDDPGGDEFVPLPLDDEPTRIVPPKDSADSSPEIRAFFADEEPTTIRSMGEDLPCVELSEAGGGDDEHTTVCVEPAAMEALRQATRPAVEAMNAEEESQAADEAVTALHSTMSAASDTDPVPPPSRPAVWRWLAVASPALLWLIAFALPPSADKTQAGKAAPQAASASMLSLPMAPRPKVTQLTAPVSPKPTEKSAEEPIATPKPQAEAADRTAEAADKTAKVAEAPGNDDPVAPVEAEPAEQPAAAKPALSVAAQRRARALRNWRTARLQARRHLAEREFVKAVVLYRKAAELSPGHAGTQAGLGGALLAVGDNEGGLQAYQKAVRLSPRNANFRAGLGLAYERSRDVESARTAYETALKLNPGQGRARAGLARLGG